MTLEIQMFLQDTHFASFGHVPGSGIAGGCGSSAFHFLRNFHAILHKGCTDAHSHQQSSVPVVQVLSAEGKGTNGCTYLPFGSTHTYPALEIREERIFLL